MGWIEKSRGTWRFKHRLRGKVKTLTMPADIRTKKQAQKVANQWSQELENHIEKSRSETVWTFAETKEKVLADREYAPDQKRNIELYWQTIFDFWGREAMVTSITKRQILEWLSGLRSRQGRGKQPKIKNTTLRHYFHAFSRGCKRRAKIAAGGGRKVRHSM